MTVENLEIKVKTDVGKSASSIKSIADALEKLEAKASAITGLTNLANVMRSISSSNLKASSFNGMAKGVENLSAAMKTLTEDDLSRLTVLSNTLRGLSGIKINGLGNLSNLSRTAKAIDRVADSSKKAKGPVDKFMSSIQRIAFYRLLRTILKEITQAFTEGLKNAYLFSAGLTNIAGHRFAQAMDDMNSAATRMKAQLGSAFISLLTALEPIITSLINLITRAADAVSQLFAAFTGKTYLRAAAVTDTLVDDFQSGSKAAKEWKNQLLGFDVINRLEDKNKGVSPSEMFGGTDAPINQGIYEFAQKLKFDIKDILFDWDDLTGEQIAKKVLAGLGGLLGASVGFMIGGVPGAVVGTILGASLGTVFSSLIFDNDGVLSQNEVLKSVCAVAGALAGGAIGFAVGGPGGATIGAVVGAGLGLRVFQLLFGSSGEGKERAVRTLIAALTAIAGGVMGFALGGPLGALVSVTVGAGIGLLLANAGFKNGNANNERLLRTVVAVLGAIAGGIIGFKLGGPFGAVLGVTIGAGISLMAVNAAFYRGTNEDNRRRMQTLVTVLGAIVGGILGFALGGPLGAVLGVTIGSGLSLAVASVMFDDEGKSLKEKILSSLVVALGALVGGAIGFMVGGPLGAVIGMTVGLGVSLIIDSVSMDAKSKAKLQSESENVFSNYVTGSFSNPSSGNVFSDYATGKLKAVPTLPFSSGGFPETGSLFIAREAGPELVGSIGGRTAVANNDQIVEAVSAGVYQAVSSAMNGGDGRAVNIYLDGKQIAQTTTRYQRQFARVGST